MKRLQKSEKDAIFCGICGGIAEYFNIDPTLVRIGAVILAIITGFVPFAIGYVIACLIIPKKSGESLVKEMKENIKKEAKSEAN